MFESQMIESTSNELVITDFVVQVVQIAVEFMQNTSSLLQNYVVSSRDVHISLLTFANKYQITRLEHVMQHKLASDLSVQNAVRLLNAGYQLNCQLLKSEAMRFVIDNMWHSTMFNELEIDKLK